ncbi:MAG: hypothetical protein UW41_C0002G0074 [Candidatus Collierbacteria bacterium GW2011_GWC2_44_18]|uniref:Peptidase M28 domain-containing protein n=1 Tax=Candidatus Collierbacteria bacterium GW2011_GWC2_44_18 TaxID=1618392 RepID=A0A0G1HT19_9BACT|nr:MAG: hypothetical protein UW16_C0010G0005 [Microgenomates group bacterium GW2011_GWC1_44_10]KKT49798.1 MAG: hypothetical protein UW41_C0002G0074 [Candidatus Collierbacteria bacterium GW2011_GWC2_44_18]
MWLILEAMDSIKKIITELSVFSPRQGENEIKAAKYIESFLSSHNVDFSVQTFKTEVSITISAELFLDDHQIPCLGGSFESGKITSASQVHFSPYSNYIETINYPSDPGVHISRANKSLLEKAVKISGEVMVEEFFFLSKNILVGNAVNPEKIVFAHYDSLGGGALDNAGSVAICLNLLTENRDLISENLFVFVGNEELSYDSPEYWGKGYREFEKQYLDLLNFAKEIIVVDGVGVTTPQTITENIEDAFPVRNLSTLISKVTWISSIQSEVLKCYHCLEDTPDKLNQVFLSQSQSMIKQKLLNSV